MGDKSLGQKAKKGILWTAIDKYSGLVIGLCISMVLARLLSPYDYGIVATASVILGFLNVFTGIGIGPAIIQRNDLTQQDLNDIFTFSVLLGLLLGIISFSSSWFISDFYNNELLKPVVRLLSLGIFLSTINMVPSALMAKNLRFKETAACSLTFQILFGIIGIISAYFGAGVYALICPPILASIFTFFYNNHFYPVKISWNFSWKPLKKIFSYSLYVFLFDTINYFSKNLDKLIIGKCFSPSALGYYEKSYRLMQMPLNNITSVIYPVLHPLLSSLQDNFDEMAEKNNRIVKIIARITFPLSVVLYYTAQDIIHIMYGEIWDPAVPVFKILALAIPTHTILCTSGAIWQSANATKYLFWVGTTNTIVTILSVCICAFISKTPEAVAMGWTISAVIAFVFTYFIMYKILLKSSLLKMFSQLLLPFANACILIAFFLIFQMLFIDIPIIIDLILKLIIAGIIIVLYLKVTKQMDIVKYVCLRFSKMKNI